MPNDETNRKARRATSEDTKPPEDAGSAIGGLFSLPSLSVGAVVSVLLGLLLFGGLFLLFAGATLFALSYGVEAALVSVGVALLVFAFVISQIATRAGLI